MKRSMLVACCAALLCAAIAAPAANAAPQTIEGITGTATNAAGQTAGTFTGTFTLQRFVRQNGAVAAVGTLTGQVTDPSGNILRTVTDQRVTLPVSIAQAECEILDLVLGPLNLDLLGLVVTLDTVHLNITAEQGPGNLLGNLLCAIAGLLDGPGATTNAVVAILNRILAILP